jgi:hypothetical protein
LKSKIINMADRLRDNADRKLASMFRSDPVADDGFSVGVMAKIKRRLWVRRLALPVAFVVGAAIAVKPLSQLVMTFSKLLEVLPADITGLSLSLIPQGTTIFLGGMLALGFAMIVNMLQD